MSRVIVGVDPHKKSVTIEVVDEQGAVLATGRFDTTSVGYRLMKTYVGEWPRRRWGTEGANGMGRPLAQRLLAQGETVLDVPAKLAVRLGVFETHSTSQRTSRWPPRRDRGSLDRGLLGRQPGSALRVRTGGGACARCPAGDRRKRHRDRPHRSIRGFVRGRPDLEETIRRLRAYAEAGAD